MLPSLQSRCYFVISALPPFIFNIELFGMTVVIHKVNMLTWKGRPSHKASTLHKILLAAKEC